MSKENSEQTRKETIGIIIDLLIHGFDVIGDSEDENSEDKEKKFRLHIRRIRLNRGFTLSQVAERLGITTNYVSQLERGERKVTDNLLVGFAKLYNIDEDVLFWMSGNVPLGVKKLILNDRNLQKALSYLHKSKQEKNKKEWRN